MSKNMKFKCADIEKNPSLDKQFKMHTDARYFQLWSAIR